MFGFKSWRKKRDVSWLKKYKREDFVRERVTVIDFNGIFGLWRTRDEKHSVGIHLGGPAYFVYYFDGAICDYFDEIVSAEYFPVFESVLQDVYKELHAGKVLLESKYSH